MTYTKDNIIGVEFTAGKRLYTFPSIGYSGYAVLKYTLCGEARTTIAYSVDYVLRCLNNGTWVVKNSKV